MGSAAADLSAAPPSMPFGAVGAFVTVLVSDVLRADMMPKHKQRCHNHTDGIKAPRVAGCPLAIVSIRIGRSFASSFLLFQLGPSRQALKRPPRYN